MESFLAVVMCSVQTPCTFAHLATTLVSSVPVALVLYGVVTTFLVLLICYRTGVLVRFYMTGPKNDTAYLVGVLNPAFAELVRSILLLAAVILLVLVAYRVNEDVMFAPIHLDALTGKP